MPRIYLRTLYRHPLSTRPPSFTYYRLYVFKRGKLGRFTCPVCETPLTKKDLWVWCNGCIVKVHWGCSVLRLKDSRRGYYCIDCIRGDN